MAYLNNTSEGIGSFAGEKAVEKIQDTLVFGDFAMGKGIMIYMVDELTFRSFWENEKLFLVNTLFMLIISL